MCINKSNFFTRSHPVWGRRGSLTSLALPASHGRRGPGSREVRRALRGAPILRAAPGAPARPRCRTGLGLARGFAPTADEGLRGNSLSYSAFIYLGFFGIFLRHLWSTWRFISLGDNWLSPNEARDLSRISQIKLARP